MPQHFAGHLSKCLDWQPWDFDGLTFQRAATFRRTCIKVSEVGNLRISTVSRFNVREHSTGRVSKCLRLGSSGSQRSWKWGGGPKVGAPNPENREAEGWARRVEGARSVKHVHKSYQQISILSLNFNTSFIGKMAKVATLEYFTLTVFSFVFVERCFSCGLGASNVTRGWQFLTRTHVFFWSRYVVLLDLAKTLVSLVLLLSGRQRWTSAEHVALSISVFLLSPSYSALSQSVFLERYRED